MSKLAALFEKVFKTAAYSAKNITCFAARRKLNKGYVLIDASSHLSTLFQNGILYVGMLVNKGGICQVYIATNKSNNVRGRNRSSYLLSIQHKNQAADEQSE